MQSVVLNGLSLTSTTIITSKMLVDNMPVPSNNIQTIYRRNRAKMVSRQLLPKSIVISGRILTASTAQFLSVMDEFKMAASGLDMVLDCTEDSGDVRRYTVDYAGLEIPREAYHIISAPFTLNLIAPDPIAVTPDYTDVNDSISSGTSKATSFTAGGTWNPEPVITITFSAGTISTIKLLNDYYGQTLTIDGTFINGDVVVIDTGKKSVTQNGTEIDYSGVFPEFGSGANITTTTLNASGSCTINIHYQPRWL